jgi:hypothetical protein
MGQVLDHALLGEADAERPEQGQERETRLRPLSSWVASRRRRRVQKSHRVPIESPQGETPGWMIPLGLLDRIVPGLRRVRKLSLAVRSAREWIPDCHGNRHRIAFELRGGGCLELPACFVVGRHRAGADVVDPAM